MTNAEYVATTYFLNPNDELVSSCHIINEQLGNLDIGEKDTRAIVAWMTEKSIMLSNHDNIEYEWDGAIRASEIRYPPYQSNSKNP